MILEEFCERYKRGDFNTNDIHILIEAGWCDWFCENKSLRNKTKLLGKKICQLCKLPLLSSKLKCYGVIFKNNCRINPHSFYDSMAIYDAETNKTRFWIANEPEYYDNGNSRKLKNVRKVWRLYTDENNFTEPVAEGWINIKNYFKGFTTISKMKGI